MTILVTAFEPFGSDTINPTQRVLEKLPSATAARGLVTAVLPTVFGASAVRMRELIDQISPDVIVCLGQAGGRSEITPERVAINIDDASIADNASQQPIDEPIAADGPAAYFSTLPNKAMVQAARAAGIPASLSNTAGTFVCNHIMYATLHAAAQRSLGIRAGFIHVPFLPEQVIDRPGMPSMSEADMVTGVSVMLSAAASNRTDIHTAEGSTH